MADNSDLYSKFKKYNAAHPIISGIIMMVAAGLLLVWLCLIFLHFWTHHGDNATVPEVKGLSYDEAARVLHASDIDIEISDSIYDTSVAPGTVVESWPKAGSVVKAGRSVYVTITAFSPKHVTISMPITGVSSRQAVSYLNALGITSIRFVRVVSEYPDLVEGAHADGRPLGVGSVLPVDATVVLEVGIAGQPEEESTDESTDDTSAEQAIEDELSGYSTYTEE